MLSESDYPTDLQLRAACTTDWRKAARVLGLPAGMIPDWHWFRERFHFTQEQLLSFITSDPVLASALYNLSLDNRSVPAPYIEREPGRYAVGWFDGARSNVQFHRTLEAAAAEYVLAFWRLPRLTRPPVDPTHS